MAVLFSISIKRQRHVHCSKLNTWKNILVVVVAVDRPLTMCFAHLFLVHTQVLATSIFLITSMVGTDDQNCMLEFDDPAWISRQGFDQVGEMDRPWPQDDYLRK